MSYSTILKLTPGECSEDLKELRNSHGSAPVIWDQLCQDLYGTKPHEYLISGVIDRLWPRWQDLSIPEHKRAVLMMTYDLAYVRKEHYNRAATDIRKWLEEYPPNPKYVNHWPAIAELYESDPDCEAIGIHQTSISKNPFNGEWNEEEKNYDPIDWSDTYEIYDQLDGLKEG